MWFFALVIVLLIGAVAVVASGRWGSMAEVYDDRPDVLVPARRALTADDIESSRFGIGVRGYRMDEVDTLLERVAREVAERDRRIADLERAVSPIMHGPEGAGFTPRAEYAADGVGDGDSTDAGDAAYAEDEAVTYAEAQERYAGAGVPEQAAEEASAASGDERAGTDDGPAGSGNGLAGSGDGDGVAEGETAGRRP